MTENNKSKSGGSERSERLELPTDPRVNPETRLCPAFDEKSIAEFRLARRDEMGFRVLDNFAEEHQQ